LNLPRGPGFNSRGTTIAAIEDEVLSSLVHAVAAEIRLGEWSMDGRNELSTRGNLPNFQRGWSIEIGWSGAAAILELLLSPAVVVALAPIESKPASTGVSRRRAAIIDKSVRLQAVLGEAQVTVGDLASLAVNDVIVLKDDISQPGYLTTESGRRVA